MDAVPITSLTKLNKVSNVAAAEILGSDEVRNELSALPKSINVSNVVVAMILGSDEADEAKNESAFTSEVKRAYNETPD